MRVLIVIGTRPEIIKLSPLVQALAEQEIDYAVLFSGQHFTPELGSDMLREFMYDQKKVMLMTSKLSHQEMLEIVDCFDIVVVQGDTTTAARGAVYAIAQKKFLVHIEAGLRSGDMRMREERNRAMIDHGSDLLLAPTIGAMSHLALEKAMGKRVMVGNTIVDVLSSAGIAENSWESFNGSPCMLTLHRPELVNAGDLFQRTLNAISRKLEQIGKYAIYPVHPLTEQRIRDFMISVPTNILRCPPMNAHSSWKTLQNAPMVFTDSGGIQEEACYMGVPCVTLRPNTERPETIWMGANVLLDPAVVDLETRILTVEHAKYWKHPYGQEVTKKCIQEICICNGGSNG